MNSRQNSQSDGEGNLLCLDLDGTLVATDTLDESLLALLRYRPWLLPRLPAWLLRGKAFFKDRVAAETIDYIGHFPYRKEVLDYVRQNGDDRTTVVLATAANERIAQKVADEQEFISAVLASDCETNLSGHKKLDKIREFAEGREFDYLGDSAKDIPIWAASRRAVLVGNDDHLMRQIPESAKPVLLKTSAKPNIWVWLKQMRIHQWAKNLLILVPLILAHRWGSLQDLFLVCVAMLTFSLMASAVYIFNDMLDLPFDRAHSKKRLRPICTGAISIRQAALFAVGLIVAASSLSAWLLPVDFSLMLVGYLLLNALYTLYLKREPVLDVLLLAFFYAYRILIGGAAIDVEISPWLLSFSMFFFLGLGMVKRLAEAQEEGAAVEPNGRVFRGRGYDPADADFLRVFGMAASCTAVLVMVLYLNSETVLELYPNPGILWFVCPLLLYWVSRVWFIANRGEMHHDPVMFALRDPISYIVGIITVALIVVASLG